MSPDVALLAMLEAASSGQPNPDGSLSPQVQAAIQKIARACQKPKGIPLSGKPSPGQPEPVEVR